VPEAVREPVERPTRTVKIGMRRFTRLTNSFSRRGENHVYAVAVFYVHYNFRRIHII
jgi:hypothetical protein